MNNEHGKTLYKFRRRPQKSGVVHYYFDAGGSPRREIPLGPDYDAAVKKWKILMGQSVEYEIQPRGHYLYRHFDGDGLLLYVGMTINPLARLERHYKLSTWQSSVATIKIQKFQTKDECSSAEKHAIKTEFPLFNILHAQDSRMKNAVALRKSKAANP